jgi:hypothetical protein
MNEPILEENTGVKPFSVQRSTFGYVGIFQQSADMPIKDNTMHVSLSDTSSCIHKQPASFKVNEETGFTSPC